MPGVAPDFIILITPIHKPVQLRMIKPFALLSGLLLTALAYSQSIPSPSAFLGYELGTRFTRHHQVVDYYRAVAGAAPDRVKLENYGQTSEGRPLMIAQLSSPANMRHLEEIRLEHLAGLTGRGNSETAIVWMSYNVHGNESVGTEAAMQTLYELLTSKSGYLENTVVILDPCMNPDGRDRYVNWFNQHKNTPYQADPNSTEHHEGWWSGRSNHYMFDLNRDWAWLTQVESQQRMVRYQQWMPHVHVDFHEQGVDAPYFFAPATEPFHEVITRFQRAFQDSIGRNHARYFDANGWFYFTGEVFDLFYPSYGDTYPTFNGAIGMTYEQGGSGRAGLGVLTAEGDTLTLKDRIAHHLTTSLSTVEMAARHAGTLNTEFRKFYSQPRNYAYRSYALNGSEDAIRALTGLLQQHQIEYGFGKKGLARGLRYDTQKNGTLPIGERTLIVPTDQPKGTLVKVLFEPNARLSDSLTYDITAWSLPYAYGMQALASETPLPYEKGQSLAVSPQPIPDAYAYLTDWTGMDDARFLAELLQGGIRVRRALRPFSLDGKTWDRGTLIVTRAENAGIQNLNTQLAVIAAKHAKVLIPAATGFVDSGKDFGSRYVQEIKPVKVAVLAGEPTSTLRFGEVWHFFEQQLHYPLTVLNSDYFDRVDLGAYDVLVLPDGYSYRGFLNDKRRSALAGWVRAGGRLIAMGQALDGLEGDAGFSISNKEESAPDPSGPVPEPFEGSERERIKSNITGAIFRARVDPTHPLAFGYTDTYYTLKLGSDAYSYLEGGTVAYLERDPGLMAGFAGSEALKRIPETLVFGAERLGRGQVVYLADNPLFRGFWEGGKLFFANALFMPD